MKQVVRKTANYSADLFGVCSALYELGGLCVMHDASGCNSTYATHDEPRWYDMDSLIYISALEEYDAVLGNDDKFIHDVCECALEEHPKFIAVFGSPIALMTGTDFPGIARLIEAETGIPTFGFKTTGMHTYIQGARQAFAGIAERFCADDVSKQPSDQVRVNLLGVTPLDFSIGQNVDALHRFLADNDFTEVSCWAMGNPLEQLQQAGQADVNLVCSATGIDAAKVLQRKYGTPYVIGLPVGAAACTALADLLRQSAADHTCRTLTDEPAGTTSNEHTLIIGEPVFATSLRYYLENQDPARDIRIACPMEETLGLLRPTDSHTDEEEDLERLINDASTVIADPIYDRLIHDPQKTALVRFPHEAYSGRMYRADIPLFLGPDITLF